MMECEVRPADGSGAVLTQAVCRSLVNNNIGDDGARALGEALKSNTVLKTLM